MSISYHVPLELYYYCDMENSNNDDKWLCQLMWAIGFVLFVMMLSAFVVIKLIGDWEQRGQFGDLFGKRPKTDLVI